MWIFKLFIFTFGILKNFRKPDYRSLFFTCLIFTLMNSTQRVMYIFFETCFFSYSNICSDIYIYISFLGKKYLCKLNHLLFFGHSFNYILFQNMKILSFPYWWTTRLFPLQTISILIYAIFCVYKNMSISLVCISKSGLVGLKDMHKVLIHC